MYCHTKPSKCIVIQNPLSVSMPHSVSMPYRVWFQHQLSDKVFLPMFMVCGNMFPDRRHPANDENKPDARLTKGGKTTTMARPLKNKAPLGAMNSVRFDLALDTMLCSDAQARGISKSDIIRQALEAYYAPAFKVTQVKPAKAKAKAKA